MNELQVDANQVINSLLEQVGLLAKEKAMLQIQLEVAMQNQKSEEKEDEVNDESV